MFLQFFKHKMKEKATKNDLKRSRGVDDALKAMNDEKKVYLEEKTDALQGVDRDTKRKNRPNEKILRTEVDRDISAI